jgi:hypothetical protein
VANDASVRHEESPHPGTRAIYTFTRDGVAVEEFTSGVKTHEDVVYFDEIWDTYRTYGLSGRAAWSLVLLTAGAAVAALLLPAAWLLWGFLAGLLAAAWVVSLAAGRILTVRLFNYDGNELAALHGFPNASFRAFLKELDARLASGRYPLQSVFEGLDLGQCEWKVLGHAWRCRFVYDRIVVERRGRTGREERVFYSLMALEPPVRLAWRLWGPAVWCACAAFAATGILALLAYAGREASLWPWAAALAASGAGGILLALLTLSVGVTVGAGPQGILSDPLPWWEKERRLEILRWYSRLIRLADRLSEIDHEDYWEYHRNKLALMKEEGFLEAWPYRSALARLNSQEREEMGE